MRIVAGEHRGRRLEAPKGKTVRPTSSLAREALFNVLSHGRFAAEGNPVAGATVLDAFAGSGANGLEALSQGAAHAVFMESNKAALAALRENVAALGEGARSDVITCDVRFPPRARRACGLVIMDPPYGEDLAAPALTALRAAGWMAPNALVAVEMAKGESFTPPEGFTLLDTRHYGKAQIVFLEAHPAA
jgi:16S rRNA (guanine966-N2)-methyltransferase